MYKKKLGLTETDDPRHKSRLVAKGYSQKECVDYHDIFAHVVKHVSIRLLLSIVVNHDLELEQLDVKTAFLHGDIDEEIYMEQPEGFLVKNKEDYVCHLKKSMYGLKQAPSQWNICFDSFMKELRFRRCEFNHCVYVKEATGGIYVYLLLYVDDMLVASKSMVEIEKVKKPLSGRFEMKDMGCARRILGMDIQRDCAGGVLTLSQSSYVEKVLQTFNMNDSTAVTTHVGSHFKLKAVENGEQETETKNVPYSNAIGSIMYVIRTICDLAYAVGLVSRYMSRPGLMHWDAVKWVLRYMKGTKEHKLVFRKNGNFKVEDFCDADFSADLDKRRSISGYVFSAGGNVIGWMSCLQPVVALSTTEAEYMALVEAIKEPIWLRGLSEEMGFEKDSVKIWCDSQSAMCLAKNNVHHERIKHVSRKLHFIRDIIEKGEVTVEKIHTSKNLADILTKGILVKKFEAAMRVLRVAKH